MAHPHKIAHSICVLNPIPTWFLIALSVVSILTFHELFTFKKSRILVKLILLSILDISILLHILSLNDLDIFTKIGASFIEHPIEPCLIKPSLLDRSRLKKCILGYIFIVISSSFSEYLGKLFNTFLIVIFGSIPNIYKKKIKMSKEA